MKKIIESIRNIKFPNFKHDKQKHFIVGYFLSISVTIMLMYVPELGVGALIFLLILMFAWEIDTLLNSSFTKKNISESIKDFLIGASSVFPFLVILIYLATR